MCRPSSWANDVSNWADGASGGPIEHHTEQMKHQNEQTSNWDMEHHNGYTACAMCMFMYTLVRVWTLVFVSAYAYSLSYVGFINNLLCMHDGADPAGGELIHYVVGG